MRTDLNESENISLFKLLSSYVDIKVAESTLDGIGRIHFEVDGLLDQKKKHEVWKNHYEQWHNKFIQNRIVPNHEIVGSDEWQKIVLADIKNFNLEKFRENGEYEFNGQLKEIIEDWIDLKLCEQMKKSLLLLIDGEENLLEEGFGSGVYLKGVKLNLADRFYILDKVMDLGNSILKLDTESQSSKHGILQCMLGCNLDNAKHLLNNTYRPQKRMSDERKVELNDLIKKMQIRIK